MFEVGAKVRVRAREVVNERPLRRHIDALSLGVTQTSSFPIAGSHRQLSRKSPNRLSDS